MEKIKFIQLDEVSTKNINYPDLYFTPEYGKACEFSDNAIWECCIYKDLVYVYIKKPFIFDNIKYFDLITPYGYSGYFYRHKSTYNEFIPLFRKESKNKNYLTEVLRQNPYIDIKIDKYDIVTNKKIFSIEINDYNNYYNNILKSSVKNKLKKALKLNYTYEIKPIKKSINKYFINLYNFTMKKVNADKYYYFNKDYFNQLEKLDNCYLINILDNNKEIIGSSIILRYKNFIHYHLSCNDSSSNCITDFLLNSIVKEFGKDNVIILGGGLKDYDSLYKFKQKFFTNQYDYTIYKNILNLEIYNKIKKNYKDTGYFPIHRS